MENERGNSLGRRHWRMLVAISVATALCLSLATAVPAQPTGGTKDSENLASGSDNRVEVQPVSSDRDIEGRLTSIINATGWFEQTKVTVADGVVFLDGLTDTEQHRIWAGELANRTRDVVAVVNRIRLRAAPVWNFAPAVDVIRDLAEQTVRALPTIALSLIVLVVTVAVAKAVTIGTRNLLSDRLKPLVLDVVARTFALLTLVLGLYLVLHIAGLSRLATTVIGGTGIAGLIAGFAFRDILENYLASILISLRNPFRLGDVVDIGGHLGVVERVTSRGTVLMDMDGNHIQIPNATVYKSIIQNYTANPNRRDFFQVGIGYENDIAEAQRIALKVLEEHPAILKDPEALVLADALGAATVNLKVYFWYDGTTQNGLKLRSSLVRLVKIAFQHNGISMPDEAREIVFPDGVPVQLEKDAALDEPEADAVSPAESVPQQEAAVLFTKAEGESASEADPIRKQAHQSRNPEESPDLLSDGEDNDLPRTVG